MDRTTQAATEVVLEGGPEGAALADVPDVALTSGDDRLKIPHRGGYEHFERLDDPEHGPVVFRWVARTAIAE